MAKFCGKCGKQLDEKTGLCFTCDSGKLAAVAVKRKQRKNLIVAVILWLLLGLAVLLLSLGALTYFGIVELPVMESVLQSVGLEPKTEDGETDGLQEKRPQQTEGVTEGTTGEHEHILALEQVVEATCTQKGYALFVCDCGESREDNVTEALGHNYESKADEAAGSIVYTCTRCEDTYTETNTGNTGDNTGSTGDNTGNNTGNNGGSNTGNGQNAQNQQSQKGKLSLNKQDVTVSKKGGSFTLRLAYENGQEVSGVSWSSSDSSIATVKDGKVTAVGVGKATITATYNAKSYTCIVRAHWTESENPGNTGGTPADKDDGDISIPIGGNSGLVDNGVIDFDDLMGTSRG